MFRVLPKEFDTPIARRLVYAFWIALAVSYYVQDVLSFIIRPLSICQNSPLSHHQY